MPEPRTLAIQSCRHCGAGAPAEVHFCPQCDRIMALTRHGDYFSFFGLPRKLTVDLADLERRFRALSRQFHPDYYYNATTGERLASLERASYLNDAFRVLKQPLDRAEYLLKLEGLPDVGKHQDAREMAPGLLEEVFTLNEELDDIRASRAGGADAESLRARVAAARRPIEARALDQERRLEELAAAWDAQVDAGAAAESRRPTLEALRAVLQERSYIANLLASVDKA
jgi:molecular chaperone HscB